MCRYAFDQLGVSIVQEYGNAWERVVLESIGSGISRKLCAALKWHFEGSNSERTCETCQERGTAGDNMRRTKQRKRT